jgi:hypothetical protein
MTMQPPGGIAHTHPILNCHQRSKAQKRGRGGDSTSREEKSSCLATGVRTEYLLGDWKLEYAGCNSLERRTAGNLLERVRRVVLTENVSDVGYLMTMKSVTTNGSIDH